MQLFRQFFRVFEALARQVVRPNSLKQTGLGFIFVVTVIGVFSVKSTTAQVRFTDIQTHWAQPCIEALAQREIIGGFPDGRFRPDETVTRSQFAAIAVKAFPTIISSPSRPAIAFKDVPSNHWAAEAIQKAYRANFFSGFGDQTFQPDLKIIRAQALTALASGLKAAPSQSVDLFKTYSDAGAIPNYAAGAIASATQKGLVVNYPNAQRLEPTKPASRGEVAALVCRALPETAGLVSSKYLPSTVAKREIRGVWLTNIDSDVLFDATKLSNAVTELSRLNFNTLYPVVWNWGYTLYPSQIMKRDLGFDVDPRAIAAGLRSRDMLKQIITEGHQKGLAVIPWFEFGFFAPKDSELAQKHKDWWTTKQDGSVDGDPRGLDGRQIPIWFNPLKPEVQKFMVDLVTEVVTNYDVDGIQFDDHFGLPVEFGYDAYTVKLYQQEHNGKSPPRYDTARCDRAGMKDSCPEFLAKDPQWAEWLRWRSNKIEQVLKQVFQAVKARKSNVIIGLSPLDLPYAYERAMVDWHKWQQDGLIEELIPQIYFQGQKFVDRIEPATHPELKQARDLIPTAIGILSGLSGNPRSIDELQRQVQAVRDRGYSGMSFFFYETLWNKSPEPTDVRKAGWQSLFSMKIERAKL
ncbi:MAG: family 10 glycosylhydrolase [Myxacorys californica WJT36-NPBG1]|jgi:uncharacterized lipoprotein YddW (UPF0748 family)|nr:family 10 glycosylhydrolase [Myxacorys californica WJT36-NPBG1]